MMLTTIAMMHPAMAQSSLRYWMAGRLLESVMSSPILRPASSHWPKFVVPVAMVVFRVDPVWSRVDTPTVSDLI